MTDNSRNIRPTKYKRFMVPHVSRVLVGGSDLPLDITLFFIVFLLTYEFDHLCYVVMWMLLKHDKASMKITFLTEFFIL